MVQYMFDGPEIDIKVKPQGNSKAATPFFTTAKKTREHIQELAAKSTPKHIVQAVTSEQGGEINARGAPFLPCNRQQVANFQRTVAKSEDKDILYSIMLECKLVQGKGELFVQDVKAASEPQFYFINGKWMILCVSVPTNTIFQCLRLTRPLILEISCDTYDLPSSLEGIHTGNHPIMISPMLVHQHMQFVTFNYFVSTLIGISK